MGILEATRAAGACVSAPICRLIIPVLGFIGGATALLMSQIALAAPPSFTGQAIQGLIPRGATPLIVNLRQLGVIAGSGPMQVSVSPGVFVNNQAQTLLTASVFRGVCIRIVNGDFSPNPQFTYAVQVTIQNLGQQSAGPQMVTITDVTGPVVDPGNQAAVAACDDPNTRPVANAGADGAVPDSNGQPGETVSLNGSASTDANAGTVLSYVWRNAQGAQIATGANPTGVSLPDGVNVITLTVTDDSFDTATNSSTDTVTINVAAPAQNQPPVANAGVDQNVGDTDQEPGETVTLNGTQSSDPDGTIVEYEWVELVGETAVPLGTGATLNVRLSDGVHQIRLQVTDNTEASASDTVAITVGVPDQNAPPTANAGLDQNVADTDGEPGEVVILNASQSVDVEGPIASYQWFRRTGAETEVSLGSGATLSVRLADGTHQIRLQITDASGLISSDFLQITVASPPQRDTLSELPNLTPNQRKMAEGIDRICQSLDELESLTADQTDLRRRCDGLLIGNTAENQVDALDELGGQDFAVARVQTLLFANTQYASVMDRLMALRGGARGLSLAGLNIIVDGKSIPLAQLQGMAKQLLGGGASSDADEPGGLLSDKWGLWARGNYSSGDKDANSASPSFDADQWALIGGLDYRLSDKAVVGGALAYGQSGIEFSPGDEGALDTTSWALSLYGSVYAAKNFYFDGIVNLANSSYDAERNITYVDGSGLVNADAFGETDGLTLSGGLSGGYDFLIGKLTISPNLGVFYIDATIDDFTESGAAGLNLIYDEQNFKSFTGNLGVRLALPWNLSWGVLLPQLRVDYVREFEDDVDVFGVRFASDPGAASTPPILVETDNPDQSYWRLAAGFSAQFKYGVSGYVEYQRLESFEFIDFQDVSVGLRMQKSF